MNYSQLYFAKPLEELTWADIESFFANERNENDRLEFKSYEKSNESPEKKLNTVIRSICAFLNSEGGIVIWGSPKGTTPTGSKEEVFTGALCPVPEKYEKDRLISKVSDSITPMPVGIKVQILENGSSYVYVFEVQQSNYSPHQYLSTYWARLDGQTKPAPHYLVEALFRKIKHPNIEGYIKFKRFVDDRLGQWILFLSVVIINRSQLQNEEKITFKLICSHGQFNDAEIPNHLNLDYDKKEITYNNDSFVLRNGGPLLHETAIVFNRNIIQTLEVPNIVTFLLYFGGRKSPLKSSFYKLDLSKLGYSSNDCFENAIIEKIENELYISRKEKLGITSENEVEKLLNSL